MNQASKIIKYLAIAFGLFLVFNIVSGIMYVVISVSNIFDEEEPTELKQLDVSENVQVLDIDVNAANIIVKESDTFKVETNNKYIKYNQEDNKLSITESKKWFKKNSSDLIIYVPSDLLFEEFKIENGAGKVSIDTLNTQKLTLDLGAGKVEIDDLNVKNEAKIDGGAGEITISYGDINNLNMDMGVGKASLTAKVTGNSEIDCGVGELNLSLIGKESDYQIKVDKGLGSFKISGEEIVDGKTYGEGGYKMDIDGGVGSVKIDFDIPLEVHAFIYFTRTYNILNVTEGQEENSYYLTLQVFQGEVDTVLVRNLNKELKAGKSYEFEFEKDCAIKIDDNIDSIFKNTTIKSINETDKTGLDQIQDTIKQTC